MSNLDDIWFNRNHEKEDCPKCHCVRDECECESGAYEDYCEAMSDRLDENCSMADDDADFLGDIGE